MIPASARRAVAGVLLAGLASAAGAAPAAHKPAPARSASPAAPSLNTPDAVVRAFLHYRDTHQDAKAYSLLSREYRKKKTLQGWLDQARNVRTAYTAVITVAGESLLIGGTQAIHSIIGKPAPEGKYEKVPVSQLVSIPTPVYLVRDNGRWRIDMDKTTNPDEPSPSTPPSTPPAPPAPPIKPGPPMPPTPPDTAPQCRANIREVFTAFQEYALDHEGRLPDANRWVDEITAYLTTPNVLKCPADTSQHRTSYAMNSGLSGKKLTDITDQSKAIVLYETDSADANPNGPPHAMAKPRHPSGTVIIFADGTPDQLPVSR